MNRKTLKNKGVMLIFSLIVISFLLILLTASIAQMQNTIFLTNRMEAEMKAEWAAMAGLEYAEACINKNIKWPEAGGCPTVGDYSMSLTEKGDCLVLNAVSSKTGSEFCIAFRKTNPGDNFVPLSKISASGQNVDIYSYNSGGTTFSGSKTVCTTNGKTHIVTCPASSGVYVGVEGRSGRYKSFAEKLYKIENVYEDYAAALFAKGGLNVQVDEKFAVSQIGGRHPSIIALGSVNVQSNTSNVPDRDGNGPLAMQEGAIFTNAPSVQIGVQSITTGDSNSMGSYGVRVEQAVTTSQPQENFPAVEGRKIPAGSYTFLERSVDQLSPLYELYYETTTDQDFLARLETMKKRAEDNRPPLAPGDKSFELVFFPEGVNATDITAEDYKNAKILLEIEKQLEYKNFPTYSRGKLEYGLSLIEEAEQKYEDMKNNPFLSLLHHINLLSIDSFMTVLEDAEYNGSGYSDDDILAVAFYQCQQELRPKAKGEFVPIKDKSHSYEFVPRNKFISPKQTSFTDGFPFTPNFYAVELALDSSVHCSGNFNFQTVERSGEAYAIAKKVTSKIDLNGEKQLGADGTIDIEGCLKGKGKIVAKNDVKIEAGGNLSSEDIALFATNNIEIKYPSVSQITYSYAARDLKEDIKNSSYAEILADVQNSNWESAAQSFVDSYSPSKNVDRTVEKDNLLNFVESIYKNTTWDYAPSSNLKGIIYAKNGNININPDGGAIAFEGVIVCGGVFATSQASSLSIRYDTASSYITDTIPPPGGGSAYSLSELFYNKF